MTDTDNWLQRYETNHCDLRSPWLYWAGAAMLIIGSVGLLWNLPTPPEFYEISPLLNWGSAFLMVTAVYYFIISLPLAIGLLPFVLGIAFIQMWLQHSGYSPMRVSAGLLAAGAISLWLGHRNKDGFAPFFEDLQTIMIGPAWLLSVFYKRIGIPF